MTYSPNYFDRGVFGGNKTIEPHPVIQIDNRYQIDPNNFGNVEIFTGAAGGSGDIDLSKFHTKLYPEDQLTIAARTASGTGATVTATIIWNEEF